MIQSEPEAKPMTEDQLASALVTQTVDKIWKELDKSADGFLSYEESKKFLIKAFETKNELPFMEAEIRSIFTDIDKDKDNRITRAEMRQFIMRLAHF